MAITPATLISFFGMRKRRGTSLEGPAFPKPVYMKAKTFKLTLDQIMKLEELKAAGHNPSDLVRVAKKARLDEWICRGIAFQV